MTSLEIAKNYFELSNESNFKEIERMFCKSSTFRSGKGELFLGCEKIMAMQRVHHGIYKQLKWTVNEVSELKPGIVRFEFDFTGEKQDGEAVSYSGVEDIVIHDKMIQHIQVQITQSNSR